MSDLKQYAERDIMALDESGDFYSRHVSAMTAEGLHAKSDIAAELGWRDMQIAELRAERDDYRERWEQTGCTRHHAMETAIKLAESYRQQLNNVAAERDWLRTNIGMAQIHLRAADAMAEAIDRMIRAGLLDPRSPIADARLDYSDPGTSLAALEGRDDD